MNIGSNKKFPPSDFRIFPPHIWCSYGPHIFQMPHKLTCLFNTRVVILRRLYATGVHHSHSTRQWYSQPPGALSVMSLNTSVHGTTVRSLQPEHVSRLPPHASVFSVSLKHTRHRSIVPGCLTVGTCESSSSIRRLQSSQFCSIVCDMFPGEHTIARNIHATLVLSPVRNIYIRICAI